MSGYPPPAGSGEEGNLDNLWASLQGSSTGRGLQLEPSSSYGYYNNGGGNGNNHNNYYSSPPAQHPHGYHQPFVQSAMPTPPAPGPQPHHHSAIMSPVETPQPRPAVGGPSNAERTSSLLSLLKFSQPTAATQNSQPAPIGTPLPPSREPSMSYNSNPGPSPSHARGASDLLATLMGNLQPKPAQQPSPQPQPAFSTTGQSDATQAYLLNLLNKPKPAPSNVDPEPTLRQTSILTPPSKASTPTEVADLTQGLEDTSLNTSVKDSAATEDVSSFGKENASPAPAKKLFTYNNPFDQLAATSPRNRTPKNASGPSSAPAIQILKHPRQDPSEITIGEISSPPNAKAKPDTSSQASAPPTPLADGRSKLEALIGIGSQKETVHQALHDVSNQADKQAQEAIARAEREQSQASIEKDLRDLLSAHTEKEFKKAAQTAAKDIKTELDKEENTGALDGLPAGVAEEVKEIIDETAQGHVADSWESADAEESISKEEENAVKVYNFPMRPWTSITIKETEEPRPNFRDEVVMDVARLRKDFDQVDRTLVTASNLFIAYGLPRGGFRIIRQDDGRDGRLFTETNDRIFNVVVSVSQTDLKEAVIGTGVNGTVYWALIKDGEDDHIVENNLEAYSFALPPLQSHDIESPGGVLKTRARKSSNHPDFFAVGRGKYIHIVWPSLVLKQSLLKNGKDRVVDVEKYLSKQSLRLNTGKAGKDFIFSDDDTVIVSLDKAGKVKFWDVRSLTDVEKPSPTSVEIKEPLVTFITTPASEKSWPTSVLFVDKLRPYQRGGALRYLIVGMKQNHILQLWDLALGKPVQEIHLPHTKESDAVCSVMYHAATGMIVVGHPTRNSIYFLHLSAPKYNLPKSLTQAQYIEGLVANDPTIPKPDSTAVMSGMREYSFANKGSLRSLDILQKSNQVAIAGEPVTLFELYSMHSKGVTTIAIKQADLGWTLENKVINAVAADKAEIITIDLLKEIPAPAVSDAGESAPPPYTPTPTRIAARPASKEASHKESPKKSKPAVPAATKSEDVSDKKEAAPVNGPAPSNKEEKRKRKKGNAAASSETASAGPSGAEKSQSKIVVLDPSSHARNGNVGKGSQNAPTEANSARVSHGGTDEVGLKRVSDEVKKLFNDSIESLYQTIKNDKRTEKAVSDTKQETMLRLVSETLAENMQATLSKIVNKEIRESVVPAISAVASKAVNDQLSIGLSGQIAQSLSNQLPKALPDSISKALQQPQLLKLMADSLAKSVSFKVEEQFTTILQNSVTPTFTKLAIDTSRKVATDVQRQASAQIVALEQQRQADSLKIEQLTQLVTGLSETVSSMAAAQSEFQAQFLKLQQNTALEKRQTSSGHGDHNTTRSVSQTESAQAAPKSPEELEFEAMLAGINEAMKEGEFESAVIQWLQTRREQEFFERYFSKFNPDFLHNLSPLLLLSLGATMTAELAGDLLDVKLTWLETVLIAFQTHLSDNRLVSHALHCLAFPLTPYRQDKSSS